MQPLTDEQRKIAEEGHNLIYSFLRDRGLSIEEWYGTAAIGYLKSVVFWDPQRGKLSTFAYRCMQNEVSMERRKKSIRTISLDEPILEDGGAARLDVVSQSVDVIDEALFRVQLESAVAQLTDRQRKIIKLVVAGYDQISISVRLGLSQTTVSREYAAAKKLIFGKKIAPRGGRTPARRAGKNSVLKV
ncbi:sigma-70 family RNA polymerase sigma factor [Anaerotruncus massiliensis (ex Liu et al. 2021)]|uniref:sigma-70 family RNA polymerase sigma factor n=1 Tax=Anaerotruncus massiliensis (ex Liu et al. 2021) TaxID=2321404 RepID=UPI003AB61BA0